MTNQKLVAISYCFAFLCVYFSSIAYALLSSSINNAYKIKLLPQTTAMDATSFAVSSFSSWYGTLVSVGILILVLAILFFVISSKAMSSAMSRR
jgi:hypothetical protein